MFMKKKNEINTITIIRIYSRKNIKPIKQGNPIYRTMAVKRRSLRRLPQTSDDRY